MLSTIGAILLGTLVVMGILLAILAAIALAVVPVAFFEMCLQDIHYLRYQRFLEATLRKGSYQIVNRELVWLPTGDQEFSPSECMAIVAWRADRARQSLSIHGFRSPFHTSSSSRCQAS